MKERAQSEADTAQYPNIRKISIEILLRLRTNSCSFPFFQRMRGHLDNAGHRPAKKQLPREILKQFHLGTNAAASFTG